MMKKSKNFCLIGLACVSSVNFITTLYRESSLASINMQITKCIWRERWTHLSRMKTRTRRTRNNPRARTTARTTARTMAGTTAMAMTDCQVRERKNTSGERGDESEPEDNVTTAPADRKSTRLNSSHTVISYAVFCLKKKTDKQT